MRTYTLSDFDFALPPDLIAQHPAAQRSGSRLLDGTLAQPVDRVFRDLPGLLRRGDLLVFNDTRVLKARMYAEKASGGKAELLIERVLGANQVAAHLRVSRAPQPGASLRLADPHGATATLLGRWPHSHGPLYLFELHDPQGGTPYDIMERSGHVPLPPYITHTDSAEDEQRYQTVFAKHPGAVAAPTAALHFDQALLDQLQALGVDSASVTLHVGAGTFSPVKTEDLSQHQMHSEWYQVPAATQQAISACRARGGRVVAVGTTTVRTLESWAQTGVAQGDTQIFITPGFGFRVVDALITNFHLPKSSLMMLVSAFAGYDHIMGLYRHAIAQGYRFFSYGDAMLLQRQLAGQRRFDLVMFDLDGTLAATAPEIYDAVADTLLELNLPPVTPEQVKNWIGLGKHELMVQVLAHVRRQSVAQARTDPQLPQAVDRFGPHYARRCGTNSQLYPQVRETLLALRQRGVKLAVVTNKDAGFARAVLDSHGLAPLIDHLVGGDSFPLKKPDPMGVNDCLQRFGVSAQRALLVGDSVTDVTTARRAGVAVWAVPYGYNMGQAVADAQPDRLIDNIGALLDETA